MQAVTLSQLGAYFDVDRPHISLPAGASSWASLSLSDWDRLFSPALHLQQQQQQQQQQQLDSGVASRADDLYAHDYLIHPVSGGCNYTRRWAGVCVADARFLQSDRGKRPQASERVRAPRLRLAVQGWLWGTCLAATHRLYTPCGCAHDPGEYAEGIGEAERERSSFALLSNLPSLPLPATSRVACFRLMLQRMQSLQQCSHGRWCLRGFLVVDPVPIHALALLASA